MTVAPVPGNGPSLFQARRTGLSVIKLQLDCHDKGTQREPSGRRERFEILKIVQGLGDGVAAVDKCPLRPLRPNAILGALEESIARRNREGRMWPALFLDWASGRRSAAKRSPKMRHDGSRRT